MDDVVRSKCPYCGCGSIAVERSLDGCCRCDRCKETFIDKTLPLKLIIKDLQRQLDLSKQHLEIFEATLKKISEIHFVDEKYGKCFNREAVIAQEALRNWQEVNQCADQQQTL